MALRQHGLLSAALLAAFILGRLAAPGESVAPDRPAPPTLAVLAPAARHAPVPPSAAQAAAALLSPRSDLGTASTLRRESARLALALHHLRLPAALAAELDPARPGWADRLASRLAPPDLARLEAHLAERRTEDIERAASLALADYQTVLLLGEDRKTDLLGALARHLASRPDTEPATLAAAERLALADAFLSNTELAAYRHHLGLD